MKIAEFRERFKDGRLAMPTHVKILAELRVVVGDFGKLVETALTSKSVDAHILAQARALTSRHAELLALLRGLEGQGFRCDMPEPL
jgi:hypothetical protein